MNSQIDADICPLCGQFPNDALMEEIAKLEAKICRLENHIIGTDKEIIELRSALGAESKAVNVT